MSDTNPNSEEVTPAVDYNPLLNEAPAKKEYQQANINPDSVPAEIPTFQFSKPMINFDATALAIENTETSQPNRPTEAPESSYANPALNDLSKKEKRLGAEKAADTALGAYAFVCEKLFVPLASINTQTIEEKIATGEMSDQITFVVDDEGNQANIRQYASVFNANVSESLKVDDEFIEDVREPLIRIMEKRGLAMTDEQYVALAFGKDLLTKGMIVFELKRSTKTITNMIIEQTALLRQSMQPIVAPVPEKTDFKEEIKSTPEIVPASPSSPTAKTEPLEVKLEDRPKTSNFQERESIPGMPNFGDPSTLAAIEKMVAQEEAPKIVRSSRNSRNSATGPKTKTNPKKQSSNPK